MTDEQRDAIINQVANRIMTHGAWFIDKKGRSKYNGDFEHRADGFYQFSFNVENSQVYKSCIGIEIPFHGASFVTIIFKNLSSKLLRGNFLITNANLVKVWFKFIPEPV